MNTAADALAAIIANAETMSTEARRTQGRRTYSAKFTQAQAAHLKACLWLQANSRQVWDGITAENKVDTDQARRLLALVG